MVEHFRDILTENSTHVCATIFQGGEFSLSKIAAEFLEKKNDVFLIFRKYIGISFMTCLGFQFDRAITDIFDKVPYYMKFWRHFNLAILAIFQEIAKLKCTKITCR